MTRRGAYAAISYMACAVLLVMFNKAALSSYKFPSANVITLFQMICSCGFLYALRRWKMISFTVAESLTISDDNITTLVPLKTLKKTLPLAGAYLLYMLASMESVRGVNVPMYTTLRRTTVVFTMVMEYILAGQRYTSPIVRSVGLIVLGAFIAGARDLSFDAYGYAVVFLSNITTAVYLATIARIGRKSSGLNSFGLMWCNGVICGPALLFLTFIRGDLKTTINFPYLFSPGFMHIPEHNSKFSAHTDNLRQLEDIEVAKTATVLELKQAVEAVFSHMPQKGPGKISWPHVWGHFCLCYGAQKLVVETDHIRHYGIKDGDQLHFVRHVSISYTLTKKQSKKGLIGSKQNTTSIPRSISLEEIEAIDKEEEQSDRDIEQHDEVFYDSDDIENPKSTHCNGEVSIEHNESTLPSLLGEWFPYSRLSPVGTTSKRSLACAPSIATGLLVGFRKMFGLCFEKRDKRYSRRDTWRID
ncbi:hypothetical protein GBA52_000252 [Prunus armeniaca]|nr:hypothetical protein GBA52_000252 [Prunus armeniaca]